MNKLSRQVLTSPGYSKKKSPHWGEVASRLSDLWGWPVPLTYASDFRFQKDPLRLLSYDERGDRPIADKTVIDSWAKKQTGVYGRGIRPLQGVYFLQADYEGLIKIGFATDFLQRVETFYTHCPCPLALVGFIFCDRKVEAQTHKTFARYRTRGEWFFPAPTLVDFVREVQERVDLDAPQYATYKKLLGKCSALDIGTPRFGTH